MQIGPAKLWANLRAIALREMATGVLVFTWLVLFYQLFALSLQNDLSNYGPGMSLLQSSFGWLQGDSNTLTQFLTSLCLAAVGQKPITVFLACWLMWMTMTIAMMLPVVLPFFEPEDGYSPSKKRPLPVLAGYFLVWTGFATCAAGFQTLLQLSGLIGEEMLLKNAWLGGAVLVGAVLYRFSPMGRRARHTCNTYIMFLKQSGSQVSPFRAGISLGTKCLKCCWAAMLTMLVFGMMNIVAMAAITLLTLWDRQSSYT